MADVTIFHNPNCSTSRHAMDVLGEEGTDAEVVAYLKAPPDRATLEHLADILEDPVADMVRHDGHFKELGLDPAGYTDKASVVELLLEHPKLLQRPILVRGDRAIIGRPKDRVRPFVS